MMPKLRLLIVDDEPIIALEIASIVQDAGCDASAVVNSIDAALAVIDRNGCDAAILDANLRGSSAAPIANRLRASGLPFFVVTGYSPDEIGDWAGDATVLTKPFELNDLVAVISKLAKDLMSRCESQ